MYKTLTVGLAKKYVTILFVIALIVYGLVKIKYLQPIFVICSVVTSLLGLAVLVDIRLNKHKKDDEPLVSED